MGSTRFEVIGQDFAGNWQAEPTSSRTWTVQSQVERVVISEVLAQNQTVFGHFGTDPDLIELHNPSNTAINLRGYSLTDDPNEPAKFVFQEDEVLQPGQYLRLLADSNQTPGLHVGFSLRREGEGVYLYAPLPGGQRAEVDSVQFGLQIPDFSIGRVGPDAQWALTVPTFGLPNQAADVGDQSLLRINEWLAANTSGDDFVEIYNPDPLPVELGGLYLSDATDGAADQHAIAPLSFIAGRGFADFQADGNTDQGAGSPWIPPLT